MPLFTVNRFECTAVTFKEKQDAFLTQMAFWLIFTGLAMICAMIWLPIPASGVDTGKYTVGFIFGTLLGTLIPRFYGTSESSKAKDAVISKQIDTAASVAKDAAKG